MKHDIEIPNLPEDWEAVAYRVPVEGEYVQNNGNYSLCRKPERFGNEHEIWKIVEDNKCAE